MVIVPTTWESVFKLLRTLVTPVNPVRNFESQGAHSVFGKRRDLTRVEKSPKDPHPSTKLWAHRINPFAVHENHRCRGSPLW